MFAELASTKRLALNLELTPDLLRYVEADAAKVPQVLINLLSNALKFSTSGRVDVSASSALLESARHRVTITVKDTGKGIEPDQIDKIFDAFEQTATGSRHGGTGLGLAISRSFARLMNGDLSVESVVDVGSCFRFAFEAEEGSASRQASPAKRPAKRVGWTEDRATLGVRRCTQEVPT